MFAKSARKLWGFRALESHMVLLPLDGSGGLGGQVIEDTVHTGDFGGDAPGDVLQKGEGHILHGGGHGVPGVDGPDDHRPVVCTLSFENAC